MNVEARGDLVVASGHPLSTHAGIDILANGGSSMDAALAMAFTQWVVSGPTCGPGGDLVVMHVELRDDRPHAVVFGGWSRVPLRFTADRLTPRGPLAAVVPGALAGAEAAWMSAGRMPWHALFDHAIAHAQGHAVTPWMARCYAEVERKGNLAALANVLDSDTVPDVGDRVASRRLGATLERIATGGAAVMYTGDLGDEVVAASDADGGVLAADDFAAVTALVGEPQQRGIGDMTVSVLPPPSQAGIVLDLLERVPPDAEPTALEFAEIAAPLTHRGLVDRCVVGVPGTAASIAAAGDSATVVVHSLAGVQYGSGWVAGDTGVALGNRVGTALSARADLPAANPVPGGLLPHTLSAALFEEPGRWMLTATPGGDRQVQWLAQAGQRFRLGAQRCSPADIVSEPRWFVCPEGDRFGVPAGIDQEWLMFAEPGVVWRDQREAAGYAVRRVESVGGGLQAVLWDGGAGWTAASDPRGGGFAKHMSRREEQH